MNRPGGTTNRVAGELLHVKGCQQQPVHTRLLPFRAACIRSVQTERAIEMKRTHVLLLLIDMTDLEPNIGVGEWAGRVSQNAIKASEAVVVLALLLVDDAKTEKDFIFLVKI